MRTMRETHKKIAGLLSLIILLGFVFTPNAYAATEALPDSEFKPIVLKNTLQKTVIRYDNLKKLGIENIEEKMNKSKIENIDEINISNAEKALLQTVGVEKTKSYVRDGDTLWIGTTRGLIRINTNDMEPMNYVQYFRGPRYFGPIGNENTTDYYDEITRICSDGNNGIYVEAKLGDKTTISHIKMESKSFKEKADKFEELANHVLDRRGMVSEGNFKYIFQDGKNNINGVEDLKMLGLPSTTDNDGLWTAMYGIGEIYKYATLKRDLGENHPETISARKSAVRAVEAVLLLCHISGRDDGFPARSYMIDIPGDPRNEVDYQTVETPDGDSYEKQTVDGFWLKKNGVNENDQRYAITQITKRSYEEDPKENDLAVMNKVNYEGYADEDYDNLMVVNPIAELTQEELNELTNLDPNGDDPTLDNTKWVRDETLDFDDDPNTSAYRIVSDIKVDIPERLRYLYENNEEYWRENNYKSLPPITDKNIVYKADTSSDEMIGHMALWYIANEYLIGTNPDADLKDLKELITETAVKFMDHILENKFRVMDATGKSTTWAKWWMEYYNGIEDPDLKNDIEFPYGFEDAAINGMAYLSFLKTTIVLTENEPEYTSKNVAYKKLYEIAFEPFDRNNPLSGSGYADATLNYLNRRMALLNNPDDYDEGDDYTLTINYSDEELYALAILPLVDSEFDTNKRTIILRSFDQLWDNMQREKNPLYTFLYQLAYPERTDIDLKGAVWFLERMPQYRIHYSTKNLDRDDIIRIKDGDRKDVKEQINKLLPPDEKRIHKNNNNPFKVDEDGNVLEMDSGAVYTIPYWMGRYYGMITE